MVLQQVIVDHRADVCADGASGSCSDETTDQGAEQPSGEYADGACDSADGGPCLCAAEGAGHTCGCTGSGADDASGVASDIACLDLVGVTAGTVDRDFTGARRWKLRGVIHGRSFLKWHSAAIRGTDAAGLGLSMDA